MNDSEKRRMRAVSALRYFIRSHEWRARAEEQIHAGNMVRGTLFAVASGLAYAASVIVSEQLNSTVPPGTGTPPAPPLPQPRIDKRRLN